MANIFDYIFNIKGDYSIKTNGLTDSTAEFQAAMPRQPKRCMSAYRNTAR